MKNLMKNLNIPYSNIFDREKLRDKRFIVVAIGLLIIFFYVSYSMAFNDIEYTDNAVVRCEKIDVVSEIAGVLKDIYFTDNSYYEKGKPLAKIEDDILKSEVQQAQAELELAKVNYDSALANEALANIFINRDTTKSLALFNASIFQKESVSQQIDQLLAELKAADASLMQANRNLERDKQLSEKHLISDSQLDHAQLNYNLAFSNRVAIEAKIKSLRSMAKAKEAEATESQESYLISQESKSIKFDELKMKVKDALEKVNLAEEKLNYANIKLDRTNIKALRSGHITNLRIFEGDFIEIGQPIASIISCGENAWIEANYKETQIGLMRPGQVTSIKLDTYPDRTFKGTVESLSYGSGATFSVLPPENAVGNFTKVVQRFPIRIKLAPDADVVVRAGMSANVKVYID